MRSGEGNVPLPREISFNLKVKSQVLCMFIAKKLYFWPENGTREGFN